jgi:hypothetical protein
MPQRNIWIWVLYLGLAMTSVASAKPSKPSKAQWKTAEVTVRAHFVAQNKELLDVTQVPGLGTTFWVRYAAGGGGVALVRGQDVLTAPGAATISEVLRRDAFLKTRNIAANDFLYLLEMLGHLPKLDGSPLRGDKMAELNPAWKFDKDCAVFTMYASRPVDNPGDSVTPTRPVTRAQLVIHADYSLAAWFTEGVDHPLKRK